MDLDRVALVTITLARTAQEERTLIDSLKRLQTGSLPLIAADGGSSYRFIQTLRDLGFAVTTPKSRGLVHQVNAGLKLALKNPQTTFILYTEPDKYPFFGTPLSKFASRDNKSFCTFPKGQQWTEAFMNQAARLAFGGRARDYCYGPLLFSRRAAEFALEAPPDLGWGWRFWAIARAYSERLGLQHVELNAPCPSEQRHEDTRADRMYRLRQLRQNLHALD